MIKRFLMTAFVLVALFVFSGMAIAVGSGKTVIFADGKGGNSAVSVTRAKRHLTRKTAQNATKSNLGA